MLRLPSKPKLAVAFSTATHNTLVVLSLGLAMPIAIPIVPGFIVTQTFMELLGQLVYVKLALRGSIGALRTRTAQRLSVGNQIPSPALCSPAFSHPR